ncbi:unnamed protein product [Hymenolepis diminuta]|uniref:Uncharacterized protein n=1 Tax=Hymenolepis diminuta TaxID=6216 RepID=A0A564Z2Q9_HYMDI|nr:unnamed protein product [Hymenolepis diminuta]
MSNHLYDGQSGNVMNVNGLQNTGWERVNGLLKPKPWCPHIRDIERFKCEWKASKCEK